MFRIVLLLLMLVVPLRAQAQTAPFQEVKFEQHPGQSIPPHLRLLDEQGQPVDFASLQRGRPAVLVLQYFRCPMLCKQVQGGWLDAVRTQTWSAGQEFCVLSVSIDPRDRPEQSRHQQTMVRSRYGRPAPDDAFRFLTGSPGALLQLMTAVGFEARYDRRTDQFAHPAGLIFLTPQGRISSYLFGVSFSPPAVQRALEQAAGGKVAEPVDAVLFLCFQYDPSTGRYSLSIVRALQWLGCGTALLLISFVIHWLREERR